MDPVCHLLVITICSQDRIRTCMVPFTWLPLSKKVRVVARMRYRSAHLTIFARTFRAVKIFSVFQPKRLLNPFSSLYVVGVLKFPIPTRFVVKTGLEPVIRSITVSSGIRTPIDRTAGTWLFRDRVSRSYMSLLFIRLSFSFRSENSFGKKRDHSLLED